MSHKTYNSPLNTRSSLTKRPLIFISLILLFIAILITACGTDLGTTKSSPTPTPTATPTPGVTPTAPIPNIASKSVNFTTSDNIKLAGLLYGKGKTAVIFSHMRRSDKTAWTNSGMPQRLADKGYMTLAYDFRGNGDSQGDNNSKYLDRDLIAAINFTLSQGATSVILVGASMGGTATLEVASSPQNTTYEKNPHYSQIAAIVTLSSPLSFSYDITDDDLKNIKAAKLFINSDSDTYTIDTKRSYDIANDPKETYLYPNSNLHGTEFFDSQYSADLTQRLLTFITQHTPK